MAWDRQSQTSTIARVGLDAARPWGALTVLGRLELARRTSNSSGIASGQILGLGSFSTQSAQPKATWGRMGVGLEGKVGPGVLSGMVHASTPGSAPAILATVPWQVAL